MTSRNKIRYIDKNTDIQRTIGWLYKDLLCTISCQDKRNVVRDVPDKQKTETRNYHKYKKSIREKHGTAYTER